MLNELETKPVLPAVLHTQKTELMAPNILANYCYVDIMRFQMYRVQNV